MSRVQEITIRMTLCYFFIYRIILTQSCNEISYTLKGNLHLLTANQLLCWQAVPPWKYFGEFLYWEQSSCLTDGLYSRSAFV